MKLRFHDPDKARACVQWCMKNVGPRLEGTPGTILHGEGWRIIIHLDYYSGCMFEVELTEHVDEHTATLFMLRWS